MFKDPGLPGGVGARPFLWLLSFVLLVWLSSLLLLVVVVVVAVVAVVVVVVVGARPFQQEGSA